MYYTKTKLKLVKTSSFILKLLDFELKQVSSQLTLDMDDFSVGAVDCFVEILYTG